MRMAGARNLSRGNGGSSNRHDLADEMAHICAARRTPNQVRQAAV
jgi:hypothetical protein